jgi:aspartyl aminopeptidase
LSEKLPREESDINGLIRHLNASVSPAHSVDYSAQRLQSNGFAECSFATMNEGLPAKGFMADAGLLLAWNQSESPTQRFHIVGAHTDSPCLKVKPLPDFGSFNWKQIRG